MKGCTSSPWKNAGLFSNIDITRSALSVFPAILTCAGHSELLAGQLTTSAFKRTQCYNLVKHISDCLNPDFLLWTRLQPTHSLSFFPRYSPKKQWHQSHLVLILITIIVIFRTSSLQKSSSLGNLKKESSDGVGSVFFFFFFCPLP